MSNYLKEDYPETYGKDEYGDVIDREALIKRAAYNAVIVAMTELEGMSNSELQRIVKQTVATSDRMNLNPDFPREASIKDYPPDDKEVKYIAEIVRRFFGDALDRYISDPMWFEHLDDTMKRFKPSQWKR